MMLFHVPSNVSSFINCGSKSACDKQEVMGGFAAWYSCPVCAYRSVIFRRFKSLKCEWDCTKMVAPQIFRICSGCASVDVPDYKDKDKFKMENLLIGQFMQHITAGPKVITNSEINSLKVILDHFRKRRGFQRPTVGPRLYQDKFPDWSKSLGEWFFLETYRDYYTTERILIISIRFSL